MTDFSFKIVTRMTVFTRQMINTTASCQSLQKKMSQICAGHKVSAANDV